MLKQGQPRPASELRTSGRVTYRSARHFVFGILTPFARVKLCRVSFGSDSSVYVQFPYLKSKVGLVTELSLAQEGNGPFTYDLGERGCSVPVDVKFSHHASGDVRFSRTGFKEPLPRKQSFPLTTGTGPVFWLFAYRLKDFVWLDEPKKKEHTTLLSFDHHPLGVKMEANWVTLKALNRNADGNIGPGSEMIQKRTGSATRVFFIGPHKDAAIQTHVLVCTVRSQELPSGVDETGTLIFVGGFDDTAEDVPSSRKRCLAFMYPGGKFHSAAGPNQQES